VSRAVHEDPRNPEAWWARSLLQEWRGDLAGAQRSLAHAQWLDPIGFPMPPHLANAEIERLVEKAIEQLHPDLKSLLSNVAVILDEVPGDPDRIHAACYLLVGSTEDGALHLPSTGRYTDVLVRSGDGWLIAERVLTLDSTIG
ncbi:MAG: nuclear transport factor 2 family protein, partial [Actinomycetota bacterium]